MIRIFLVIVLFFSSFNSVTAQDAKLNEQAFAWIECKIHYDDGETEDVTRGSGAVISKDGLLLTAKHVVFPEFFNSGVKISNEIRSNVKCYARLGSPSGEKFNISIVKLAQFVDAAVVKIETDKLKNDFAYLPICNSDSIKYNRDNFLKLYGFPIDASSVEYRVGQVNNFNGPDKTWRISEELLRGDSGGPVIHNGNIIGIIIGGTENIPGYDYILPEYEFRNIFFREKVSWCPCSIEKYDLISFQDCPFCPKMKIIEAGTFLMGAPASERRLTEGPQHNVSVPRFGLSIHEVTKRQFSQFIAESGYKPESSCLGLLNTTLMQSGHHRRFNWRNPGFEQDDNHPVVCIDHNDMIKYIEWLNTKSDSSNGKYRLPSESEWEYAARAGTDTRRYWGDDIENVDICRYSNSPDESLKRLGAGAESSKCDDEYPYTAPVGSLCENAFGIFDMIGNVSELVSDCFHEDYQGAPNDGAAWGDGQCVSGMVARGSNWAEIPSSHRVSKRARSGANQNTSVKHLGFRVAKTLP